MHLNLVTHNPIVIRFSHWPPLLSSLSPLFWEVAFFSAFSFVHSFCNVETDTCLLPYNPFFVFENWHSGGCQYSQGVRVQVLLKPNICTVVEQWIHGYFCLGCFPSPKGLLPR